MENPIFSAMTQYGFQTVDPYVCVGTWKTYAVTLRRFTAQSLSVNLAVRLGKPDKALRKTLPARHHDLIPANEEALRRGIQLTAAQ